MKIFNRTFTRGDKQTLHYQVTGDHSSRKLIWALKEKVNPVTGTRLLEKKNLLAGGSTEQIEVIYANGVTDIYVFLQIEDTDLLEGLNYVADIKSEAVSDAEDRITIIPVHTLKNLFSVQTNYDGLPESDVISFIRVDLNGIADNCFLVVENGELVNKTLNEVKTILGII